MPTPTPIAARHDPPPVELATLTRLFANTTNSYKYLFFLAILSELEASPDSSAPALAVPALVETALAIAWFPHTYFRLSFGSQDQIGRTLDGLKLARQPGDERLTPRAIRGVREAIARALDDRQRRALGRYVPYRLIAPWFHVELCGLQDAQKDRRIQALSHERFDSQQPLYRIDSEGAALQLHPAWASYLRRNGSAVRDWAHWHWLQYMQRRNPMVPNIAGKLVPPLARDSLTAQRRFWQAHLEGRPMPCIYTGQPLAAVEALDHFLPWSFVLHDRWWNLVPIATGLNSAKSDALPSLDFLPGLAAVHADALSGARQRLKPRAWQRITLEYRDDLGLTNEDLSGDVGQLERGLMQGYERVIPPLEQIGRHQRFPAGWRPAP